VKKALLTVVLIAMAIRGFGFAGLVNFSAAQSETTVSGIISFSTPHGRRLTARTYLQGPYW
jgi:hypothetical protein